MLLIYVLQNKHNHKIYVGQTTNLRVRLAVHRNDAKRLKTPLYRSIRKNGWDAFTCTVIEECESLGELDEAEVFWISFFNSTNMSLGYNLESGGRSNKKLCALSRLKMSRAKRGRRQAQKKPPMSEETRKKLSAALKGRTVWNKGLKLGPQHPELVARRTAAAKGKPNAGHFKKGAPSPKKGVPGPKQSPETIRKRALKLREPNAGQFKAGFTPHNKKYDDPVRQERQRMRSAEYRARKRAQREQAEACATSPA